jgi:hypothetical protein
VSLDLDGASSEPLSNRCATLSRPHEGHQFVIVLSPRRRGLDAPNAVSAHFCRGVSTRDDGRDREGEAWATDYSSFRLVWAARTGFSYARTWSNFFILAFSKEKNHQ